MKKVLYILILLVTSMGFSQDVLMENGTFNRCAPDIFYDSGGEFGNYANDENYTTTICPQNADEFIILDFYEFSTQLNQDVMTIYDGDDTSAPVIGTYTGAFAPGFISSSDSNASGCITISFTSNDSGNTTGWAAEILCGYPCQDIVASIDSTTPEPNASGVVSVLPGDTVDFSGSATFSDDDTDATYSWNFGDGNTASGNDVSNTFTASGTYFVTLTVTDNNPQGCTATETITVFVLGPNIVVDEDSYTAAQLIEDILIDSPCATVSNIISSTGIDFGTPHNGIGYFISDGVNFPFAEGVLLASSDASSAEGPNSGGVVSDGAWPGDPDLDNLPGVTNTNDATYIQFDFVPLANSISFDFLMASEEYNGGSFECNYSDAFAFFLTDSNGVTTNLAVLPGTNTPITVTNIHQANGSCGAANAQYFGGYTPNNGPPISYDGRTTVFTAQSAVIPGEQYTIKLVIADDRDSSWDSGVFLKAGSFDLGGNLGDDITIANGTAGCLGDDVILDTGLTTAVHTWYKDDVEIPGETSSIYTVTESGIYRVDFDLSGVCQGSADPIEIEFRSNPTIGTPQNLYLCELGGSDTAEFDLSQNTSLVLDGQNPGEFVVSYHPTQQDAIDNLNELSINYTNISNPQTIWVRIADTTDFCYETGQFDIVVTDQPTINPVANLELCDDDSNDGVEEFDLSLQDLGILGVQPSTDFNVTYHLSFADADAGTGVLPDLYTNVGNPEPIYVRVENVNDPDCYNATVNPLFELIVNPRAIANEPAGMELCDDISNDGVADFDLSSQEADILGGQDPAIYTVSFHASQADAEANQSALPSNYTGSDQETIYVRVEDPAYPDCYGTTSFVLTVNPLPEITVVPPLQVCDDDTDNYVSFPLSTKTDELLNGQTGVELSYHSTPVGADIDTDEIFDGYIGTDETIYVRLVNTTTNCYNVGVLNLEVLENPIANPTTPLEVCDDDNDGFAEFDLTLRDAEVIGAQTGMVVSYHANPGDAETGDAPLPSNFTNTDPDAQEIYVRIENATTGCYATTTLQLIVNPIPTTVTVTPYELCDYDNPGDEIELFDLPTKDAEILNGQVNVTVAYYESQADVDAGNAITALYPNNTGNP
ncbi:choice-of-anchor L domain-containing protein, partial [Winogradskyella sp. SYSU M77433]|uniref:choice-of-anchor L domain-containing protein n=1 Tax=Winogradskyella sp. SYSU M77433 TaxID=3042722 RepID=UPI002480DEE9